MANLILLAAGAAGEAAEPTALGLTPPAWVALSMAVLILIAVAVKVPAMLTGMIDGSIAEIRKQLDEAKALRADAEKLRADYAAKIAGAEKEAADMLAHAKHEAEALIAKAEADTTAIIGRREKMAADKIEAAERGAIADLRAKTAEAATAAARALIAQGHTAGADGALVDAAIAGI